MKKQEKKFSLKDELFNEKKVCYLADLIFEIYPKFEKKKFIKNIVKKFPELELKERIFWIRENLEKFLPKDFKKSVKIILKSLPKELDNKKTDGDFGNFIFAPMGYFVSENGCNKKYLKFSLKSLARLTKNFSVEDQIRFFINKFPKETFEFMKKMSKSKNYHQRRLSSEGLRPKLPWSIGIDFDYKKSLEVLDNLYFDKTRFVVRSVANHLNDISKVDPDFVVEILRRWKREGKQEKKEFEYLVNHSLRTSIKKGQERALNFLGFSISPKIKIKNLLIKKNKINLGEYLEFSFEIFGEKKENLVIDYKIIYPSKSFKKSEKVFKIKKLILKKKEQIKIEKKHLFKKMTTKKLYSGEYILEIQINGKVFGKNFFSLEV